MTDNTTTPAPTAGAPPSGQSLLAGVLVAVVVLLILAVVAVVVFIPGDTGTAGLQPGSPGGANQPRPAPAAGGSGAPATTVNTPPPPPANYGQSPDAVAARLSADAKTLAGMVTDLQARLREREEELRGTITLYTAATRQVGELEKEGGQARILKSEVESLRQQLSDTLARLDAANKRAQDVEQLLAGAPDQNTVLTLRRNLDEASRMRDTYLQQLRQLEAKSQTMVSAGELSTLQSRLAQLEPENEKLRYELQKLRTELNRTRLFVDKADDLPPAAKQLFVELSKLETVNPSELRQQYSRIEQDLGCRIVDTISFETGSSRIDLDRADTIRTAVNQSGDTSYFLVVGYASKTGNFELNKNLSAERATTIASVTDHSKKPTQGVQAVFLGQTDRFSASDYLKNQICEIWELRVQ
jgi:outer membrane protein OmpA-like peptidoglycan-associated protein